MYVIYLVLAVLILHIIVADIVMSVYINVDSDKKKARIKVKAFFIPVFSKTMDLDRFYNGSVSDEEEEEEKEQSEKSEKKKSSGIGDGLKGWLIRVGLKLVSRIRVRCLDMDGVISTGDAATTAVVTGTCNIGYDQACAYFGLPIGIHSIKPEYGMAQAHIDIFGIFSLCFADIIYAVAAGTLSNSVDGKKRRALNGNFDTGI